MELKFNNSNNSFELEFEIKRYVNNLKRYSFKISKDFFDLFHEEIYEENIKKEKMLIGYKDINILKYNNVFFSSLGTLKDIRVILPNDETVKNKIIEFFNLNKNNYSLQSLFI